ncbi:MAG: butyryl-CoA dehydrogenase [Thermoplasmata archaeon]|jgi:alkylation response protein AidB-like acyl-CoA dehydrogenase|nr:butyryl-CoA dehydrogenase [Thermoplasmata archaeon]
MEFAITEEQRLLRQTVQEFVAKEIAPHVEAWEEKGDVPDAVFRKLGELGLLGAPIPTEYGGAGLDAVTYAMLTEELAKGCSSLRTTISVNTSLFGMNVLLFGNEAQKRLYLPKISSGEKRGAWALTEPQSGSDAAGLRTTAVKRGDKWVLNGHKMWISDGGKADYHVVYARTDSFDPKTKRNHIATFVVHKDDPGFKVGSVESKGKLGLRASPTAELLYEDCTIPADRMLGKPDSGWEQANKILNGGRLSVAAGAVGIAQAALDASLAYVKSREAFGKKIGEFQLVKEHVAYMALEVETMRLLVYKAAWMKDQGLDNRLAVSLAKLHAGEACTRVTERAVQLHGGNGFSGEYPVERYWRDSKIIGIYEGTNEIQKVIIGGEILGV